MSRRPPDFDELAGDADPAERALLERAHRLLVATEAPPDVPARLSAPPELAARRAAAVRRPRWRAVALAAALGVTTFAAGVLVGDRLTDPGTFRVYALTSAEGAPGASATLEIFDLDEAGNWPMELSVRGLGPPAGGGRYELWLTRGGEPAELCGTFLAEPDGTTVVPMNAPWRLDEFDGWLVVEETSRTPVLGA